MRLWRDAKRVGGDDESLNPPARVRPHSRSRVYPEYITDPVEQFLYACDVTFFLIELELDKDPLPLPSRHGVSNVTIRPALAKVAPGPTPDARF